MAELEKKHVFDGSLERVFTAISQFEKYPEYLPGVTSIQILPAVEPESFCQIRYELNFIKTFHYVLNMYQDKPQKICWTLAESNIFKENSGHWQFKKKSAETTEAIYNVNVKFKGLIPSAITDQIAKANIPLMFSGFQRLIDSIV